MVGASNWHGGAWCTAVTEHNRSVPIPTSYTRVTVCIDSLPRAHHHQALASLREASTLQTLTLNLYSNQVGEEGAKSLALLRESRSLRCLDLGVWPGHGPGVRGLPAKGKRQWGPISGMSSENRSKRM